MDFDLLASIWHDCPAQKSATIYGGIGTGFLRMARPEYEGVKYIGEILHALRVFFARKKGKRNQVDS